MGEEIGMSIAAMSYVWENSKQEGGALLIMLALADYSNDRGEAYPSVKTLGKKARLGERQVQRVIQHLEQKGEITILKNAGPNGVNIYRINRGDKMTGVTSTTPGGDMGDAKGVTSTTPKPSGNRQEPSEAQSALPLAVEAGKKRFIPPTQSEVKDYFIAAGWNGSADREASKFIAYYQSVGWSAGRKKLTCWKGAAAGWKLRAEERETPPVAGTPKQDECRDQWKPWIDANYPAAKFPQLQRQYEYADDFIKTEFFRATRSKKAA